MPTKFSVDECLNDMSEALKPIVSKYKNFIDPIVLSQLDCGNISETDALYSLIEPAIVEAIKNTLNNFLTPNTQLN